MNCPHCEANLSHLNAHGEPLLRTRGLIFKSAGLICICPKCKKDVPVSPTMMKAMQERIVLFFRRPL